MLIKFNIPPPNANSWSIRSNAFDQRIKRSKLKKSSTKESGWITLQLDRLWCSLIWFYAKHFISIWFVCLSVYYMYVYLYVCVCVCVRSEALLSKLVGMEAVPSSRIAFSIPTKQNYSYLLAQWILQNVCSIYDINRSTTYRSCFH